MTDTNVFQLTQPGTFADPLTEVLRNGARALPTQAVEAEVSTLLSNGFRIHRVLQAEGDRKPRRRCGLDCDLTPAAAGQDGQD